MNKLKTDYVDPTFAYSIMNLVENLAGKSYNKTATLAICSEREGWVETMTVLYRGDDVACLWGHTELFRSVVKLNLINVKAYPLRFVVSTLSSKIMPIQKENTLVLVPLTQMRIYSSIEYGIVRQLSSEECFRCINSSSSNREIHSLNSTLQYLEQT